MDLGLDSCKWRKTLAGWNRLTKEESMVANWRSVPVFSFILHKMCVAPMEKRRGKWLSLSDGIGGSKDESMEAMHVSTAETQPSVVPGRSAQERSNQQHSDVCTSSVKCWLQ
jgi:hypothetical protein